MGMLDSDSEELKKQNERSDGESGNSGTGRKVNLSGLGPLKHLSKINSLTAKHRKVPSLDAVPAVEHSRPTITDASSEVSAESVQASNETKESKSVQSPGKVSAGHELAFSTADRSVNSEVSAKSVQPRIYAEKNNGHEVSAKSVQLSGFDVTPAASGTSSFNDIPEKSEVGAKSVQPNFEELKTFSGPQVLMNQNRSKDNQNSSPELSPLSIPSAKSVQISHPSEMVRLDLQSGLLPLNGNSSLIPSESSSAEASAKSGQPQLYAKSVQSQGEVSAVESSMKVSAKSGQVEALPVSSEKIEFDSRAQKVRAKSVQVVRANAPLEVRAKPVQFDVADFKNVPQEVRGTFASKVNKLVPRGEPTLSPMRSVFTVSKTQKAILDFIFELCLYHNTVISPPLTSHQLATQTRQPIQTVLSNIKRLRAANFIDRYDYKDGKAGWTRYELAQEAYKELVREKEASAKSVQNYMTYSNAPNPPSAPAKAESWFKTLNFSPVAPIGPMLVNKVIRGIVEEKLDADEVQEFINRFTPWLATQGKISSPAAIFCDKLKEFASEGDSAVLLMQSEADRQAELEYLKKVESRRAENELILKARAEQEHIALDEKFAAWVKTATKEEKEKLCKPSNFAPYDSENYHHILKLAFSEQPAAENFET